MLDSRRFLRQAVAGLVYSSALLLSLFIISRVLNSGCSDMLGVFVFFIFFFALITLGQLEKKKSEQSWKNIFARVVLGIIILFSCVALKIVLFKNEALIQEILNGDTALYFIFLFIILSLVTFVSKVAEVVSQNKKTNEVEIFLQILPSTLFSVFIVCIINCFLKNKLILDFVIQFRLFSNNFVLFKNEKLSFFITLFDIFIFIAFVVYLKYKNGEFDKNPFREIVIISFLKAFMIGIALNVSINLINSVMSFDDKNFQSYLLSCVVLFVTFCLTLYFVDFKNLPIISNDEFEGKESVGGVSQANFRMLEIDEVGLDGTRNDENGRER